MKKIIAAISCFIVIIMLVGCKSEYYAKEEKITKRIDISDVTEIEVKDISLKQKNTIFGANLYIESGIEQYVSLNIQEDLADKIIVKKLNNKLMIYGDKYTNYVTDSVDIYVYGYVFNYLNLSNVNVKVADNTLSGLNVKAYLSGASKLEANSITTKELNLDVSGASTINIEEIASENLKIVASGASSVNLNNGEVTNLNINESGATMIASSATINKLSLSISGASYANFFGATVNTGEAIISGASKVKLTFMQSFIVSLSGASKLEYYTLNGNLDVVSNTGASSCVNITK